ncbi:MAG: phenylacetate-CoA oxygenase subunit PaaC [Cyclobacteriaceae bacterium]|nr:phenylacetate-CoA oxygenase subunit PaaC [Cyclobacteriaceae bacterium]MCB0498547.1 phenylacetate-CoA oxygenase subunit PaaC [Cyclobacteriaceae bacterium]MCB9236886.1 phenylacetate-CoA oxygenase subunit PaaC [Flammeovirgaceae bacterium]MCO5271511.1 phenylacetate-CoA oxygenase subunit PaaC [Cyclobacteriaceae bacterium]MCW5901407.1 phenylacetate-CoA oxygenase subunit PaaC [Cyclobacteriaceae bacterium]
MNQQAIKELLYKMADDQLILGHRNSEWTGFGPLLEEDIAFSSMAQDKIGHSLALYTMLHDLGEQGPDTIAFLRSADQFHNSQFTELPNAEYDFSLIRHFLYDTAETIRFEMLSHSSYMPLAQLAVKVRGELRYHTLHANTWINQLGNANEESIGKLQRALEHALPYALGLFEPSPFENELIGEGVFEGEKALEEKWKTKVAGLLAKTQLQLPQWEAIVPQLGGRSGKHTAHLQPLLDEMGEVFRIDPTAEW